MKKLYFAVFTTVNYKTKFENNIVISKYEQKY